MPITEITHWWEDHVGGTLCHAMCCMQRARQYRYITIDGVEYRQQACDQHAKPQEPEHVRYAILAPSGSVLDSGEGTIGEVDGLREILARVFPHCSMRVLFPLRHGGKEISNAQMHLRR